MNTFYFYIISNYRLVVSFKVVGVTTSSLYGMSSIPGKIFG